MHVLRRIFRQVGAEGLSMGEVRRRLRGEGVPSAMGGGWPRSTIRYLLLNELYLPRLPAELEGLLPARLLAGLDPDREYGLWTWNKTRQTRWRERGADGEYRNRVKNEPRPREQWSAVAVDLSGSGLSRPHAEAARRRLEENGSRRPASTRAARFWLLSGGMARCAHCGNALTPHTLHQRGKIRYYYRCYTRFNYGLDACDNGRSTAAAPLEDSVWKAVYRVCSDPELVMGQYDAHVERRAAALRDGTAVREEQSIVTGLRKLLARRSKLIDLEVSGIISREDLRTKLADADGRREGLEKALADARSRKEEAERLRGEREVVYRRFAALRGFDLRTVDPEERRRVLLGLSIEARVDRHSNVRVTGAFDADITELLPMSEALRKPPAPRRRSVRGLEIPSPHKGVVTVDNSRRCTS